MNDIFCKTINDNGYSGMIYANTDYLKKGFSALTSKYPLWLADWSTHNPQYKCEMWQYTDRDSYKGIKGNVDANIYYGKLDIENPKIVTIDDIKSIAQRITIDTVYFLKGSDKTEVNDD